MLTKVKLGSRGIKYIKGEFLNGNDLALSLLQLPLELGDVITYLPESLKNDNTISFTDSMMLSKGISIRSESQNKIAGFIISYLKTVPEAYAIFETLGEVGDEWVKLKDMIYFSFESKVYQFLTQNDLSDEKVKNALNMARDFPFICILSKITHPINEREVITQDRLKEIVKSTNHIIVGAYDEEGYLICENIKIVPH